MTIRKKVFAAGQPDQITTYAGSRAELIELASSFAEGSSGVRADEVRFFQRAVRGLSEGMVTESAGRVQFWCDAPDGTPFRGPAQYRPPGPGEDESPPAL